MTDLSPVASMMSLPICSKLFTRIFRGGTNSKRVKLGPQVMSPASTAMRKVAKVSIMAACFSCISAREASCTSMGTGW